MLSDERIRQIVEDIYCSEGTRAEIEHSIRAALAEAAPDLLDALKDALCCLEVCGKDYDYAVGKARAAIAKIEGGHHQ